jgi:hypothetical protein
MAYYLVERYVPSMAIDDLMSAVARLDTSAYDGARHLWTVLVRGEDTCLSVFEAADARAVEAANARVGFRVDRVVEVTSFEATRS